MIEARATARFVRTSAQKAGLVFDLIRGREVNQALAALSYSRKAVARDISKVLRSAIANASENQGWRQGRYDLVLLSASHRLQRDMAAWRQIQREHPGQQFLVVADFSLRLCPVIYNGEQVLSAQGPEQLLERIASLLPTG